jgi:hypothetical protein
MAKDQSGMDLINMMRQRLNKKISENLQNKGSSSSSSATESKNGSENGAGGIQGTSASMSGNNNNSNDPSSSLAMMMNDPKMRTWLEVQSRSKQVPVEQFYQFTISKREEVRNHDQFPFLLCFFAFACCC